MGADGVSRLDIGAHVHGAKLDKLWRPRQSEVVQISKQTEDHLWSPALRRMRSAIKAV